MLELPAAPLQARDPCAEVDTGAAGEIGTRTSGLGVQCEEPRAECGVYNAGRTLLSGVPLGVGPVREAARSNHRVGLVRPIQARIEGPELLAGLGVQSHGSAVRSGDVEHAVDHDRRSLERGSGHAVLVRVDVTRAIRPDHLEVLDGFWRNVLKWRVVGT